ncbi:MAG TPA: hypothetical protein DCS66_22370 [Flavobacteriaceae bacterium]|nr:hypothetical protein [Flavobacteriaceae bacterium]|tara:strand:- start:302 stop:541 length:240 start_codon:yes stop_codon:yes gene_type:complete
MRGYSQKVIIDNKKAKPITAGVKLGKLCIKLMYPAAEVAKKLNTSRQCVYDWFCGKSIPSELSVKKINRLIDELITQHK